ncbi:beta-lactamase/transpeptidase-like protein [Obelidium mucronatum]|nr:beta-lactamase/transpeptidase-like protein [Obelidium mucronatum]
METAISTLVPTLAVVATALVALYLYFVRKGPAFSAKCKFFGLNPPPKPPVVGFTADGFHSLRAKLAQGFLDGDDLGSQLAVYVDGRLVADLAAGFTDRRFRTAYAQDTLQLVFSTSKLVTSAVVAHLINTGRLSLDGSNRAIVAGLLAHRGGVAFLDGARVATPEELRDLDCLAAKIGGQAHNFGGAEVSAYHAVSRGWFLNEVVRRATGGKTVRDIMYDEITPLLNRGNTTGTPFEFNYGIPDSPQELHDAISSRLVKLDGYTPFQKMFFVLVPSFILKRCGLFPVPQSLINAYTKQGSPPNKSLFKSGPDFMGRESEFPWSYNDDVLLSTQSPSFCCLTNARSLARLLEMLRRSEFGHDDGVY